MNNEKILIGKKGNDMLSGYIFYPYIKILDIRLPLKMVSWNNGNPIFTKQT